MFLNKTNEAPPGWYPLPVEADLLFDYYKSIGLAFPTCKIVLPGRRTL